MAALRKFLFSEEMIQSGFALLLKSANYLRLKKKIAESLNVLDMALEKCDSAEKLIKILYLRGDVYLDDKRYDESITCYSLIIDLKPHDIAYNNRGVSYWELGKYQQALADYESAIKINPKSKIALYGAGEIHLRSNDVSKAIECFNRAIEIDAAYQNAKEGLERALQRARKRGQSEASPN